MDERKWSGGVGFFFRDKRGDEMGESDWSSDVRCYELKAEGEEEGKERGSGVSILI